MEVLERVWASTRFYYSIGAKKFARSPGFVSAGKKRGFCRLRRRSCAFGARADVASL
jgi:hypothetical protein